jgi:polysaccharide export outer membrane protein
MKYIFNKFLPFLLLTLVFSSSCSSRKGVVLFQDSVENDKKEVFYVLSKIQINDILDIRVTSIIPESALPYNFQISTNQSMQNPELLRVQGYMVNADGTISFPILGALPASGKSVRELEKYIEKELINGKHLVDPTVRVRVINGKFTVLGEVNAPGTFNFSEENITLPQALGFAGDLTIRGLRKNILIIRQEDGIRTQARIDVTKTDWFNTPFFYVKRNDIIVVEPNGPKVKTAGYIGDLGTFLGVFSLVLSTFLLIIK